MVGVGFPYDWGHFPYGGPPYGKLPQSYGEMTPAIWGCDPSNMGKVTPKIQEILDGWVIFPI